jgi:type IV secretion/conjugal transfer VirB4 family ATPase
VNRIASIVKDHCAAGPFEALVNLDRVLDERTVLTRAGDLMTVLKVNGRDAECFDPDQIDDVARRFEAALRSIGEDFRIYQYRLRRPHAGFPRRDYDNPVVQEALGSRTDFLNTRVSRLYTSETYLVVVYLGWRIRATQSARDGPLRQRVTAVVRRSASVETAIHHLDAELERASQRLRDTVDAFVINANDVVPLSVTNSDDAFRFFRRLTNYSPTKSELGQLIRTTPLAPQLTDSVLECHRDHLRLDDEYVQVLSLKLLPAKTYAHLLRALDSIPCSVIVATEWQRIDRAAARRLIQSIRRHFHTAKTSLVSQLTASPNAGPRDVLVDDSAQAVVDDLGQCLEEVEGGGKSLGSFSLSIVVHSADLAHVRRATAEAAKLFAAHDGRVIEERYNLLNAWLAVLPGNDSYNLRRQWLLDSNYADFSFLFGQDTGDVVNKHLGAESLAVLETDTGEPFHLNLHHGDVAHTVALGPPGTGKSFTLNFLITNAQKYNPIVFIFDLGGGYQALTRLFGGGYTSLSAGTRGGINPFCLPPTDENLHFLPSFCRVLIETSGYTMTGADEKDLHEQVENLYTLEAPQRRLLTLSRLTNRHLRAQLAKWVQGGAYATWFDNVTDTVSLQTFQTLDFEGLNDYPQVLQPLIFYVLHRANSYLTDGEFAQRFKVLILDEAWRFLRHPVIRAYVVEALKTWRKKNAAVVLATQSVDDLEQSELLPTVLESCPTKLFLANPGMDAERYRRIFHLNKAETERIAGLTPKRQVLLKRPGLSKVLTLNVDKKSYWLYTNSPAENALRQEAFERHGVQQGLELLARRLT